MTEAVGPVYTGGFEEFVVQGQEGEQYTILYLPDLNNDALQQEGKAPVYYWVPGSVRLARKGDVGDYKFRHIHFVGVPDPDLHVGVEGHGEVAGGILSFTVTSRYPTAVLQQAQEKLLEKFRGKDERYWGWNTQVAPMVRIVPIKSNQTCITNLAPGRDGTAPAEGIAGSNTPSPDPAGGPPSPRSLIRRADLAGAVIHGRATNASKLDAWAWELQGQGPGSVTGGENAFAGLIGQLPSELVWAGFHGTASPLAVAQHLMLQVWSQTLYLKISGNWDRIFEHFSSHVNASFLWTSADIKAEFNSLRMSGGIQVEMHVDGTVPDSKDMEENIQKRIDVVIDEFMKAATQRIFEPAPPTVEPAQAPSGGVFSSLFGGAGFALKYRRDTTQLNLNYEERRKYRYLQPTTISSSFDGFFNEIKRDPEAERKYFARVVLYDQSRKVSRIVKPVVNWPDPSKDWVGEPVAFLSAEVGYPGPDGSVQWAGHVFQNTDTSAETAWKPAFALRKLEEVVNRPANWSPDKAYIRRRVHLAEPIGMSDNPHVKVDVEKNVIDLDPADGMLGDDKVIEVRADAVGKLEVGPIGIDVVLQDASQVVTVELQPDGKKHDGTDRASVKFQWKHDDQDQPRYWEIFTGQLDYVPRYSYRVSVNVKGTLFTKGMSWTGPWLEGSGNGPLMLHVPAADEEGVVTRWIGQRSLSLSETDETIPEEPTETSAAGDGFAGMPPSSARSDGAQVEDGARMVSGYAIHAESSLTPASDDLPSSRRGRRLHGNGREAAELSASVQSYWANDQPKNDLTLLAAGWIEG